MEHGKVGLRVPAGDRRRGAAAGLRWLRPGGEAPVVGRGEATRKPAYLASCKPYAIARQPSGSHNERALV